MVYGGALAAGAFSQDQLTLFGTARVDRLGFLAMALAGTIGYVVGSVLGWAIGLSGAAVPRAPRAAGSTWPRSSSTRPSLVRALGQLGRARARRCLPVVRSFISIPGRHRRDAPRPVHRPDHARLDPLVLRPRGGRRGARRELGALQRSVALRGLRGRPRAHRSPGSSSSLLREWRRRLRGGACPDRAVDSPGGDPARRRPCAVRAAPRRAAGRGFAEVLDSDRFILGPNVDAFEREAAAFLGVGERSASRTAPTRSCSSSRRSASARATRSSARRSRSTRRPSRSPTAARRRSSATSTP